MKLKTIYAIPGLSTTKELFKYLQIENAQLKVLEWPAPLSGETMVSYAKKMADQINTNEPFYLLGVSFGGMLCVEISKILKPEKTILISSCKNSEELPYGIKLFKYIPLHLILTENMSRAIGRNVRRLVGFDKSFLPLFIKMVNSMPARYFKSSFSCIINWKEKLSEREDIIHIHGDSDKLLPHKYVKANYIIKGGNHAMIVYKADEISSIINKVIKE